MSVDMITNQDENVFDLDVKEFCDDTSQVIGQQASELTCTGTSFICCCP